MLLEIGIMAIVGTLIGWFTNYLAVKLIFRPLDPWKMPLVGIEFQGLIPKRRMELARSIGKTVEEQLVSIEELLSRLIEGENKQEILVKIKTKILDIIDEKIPFFIPGGIKSVILQRIADILNRETEGFIDRMIEDVIHKATQTINIGQMVEDKINGLDLVQLERMILQIGRQELKHIELLGGVLGFIIGVSQGVLIQFLK